MKAMNWNALSKILASLAIAIAPWVVSVVADSAPTKSDPAWLTDARASIKSNNYDQALKQLQSANDVDSADWNNRMGYSLRKKQPPLIWFHLKSITRQHSRLIQAIDLHWNITVSCC
ncbi:hypothetical protein [Polynucleobacter necessarius]|uniref:hypothetical protein n=1 Tax=Polynucleobacter necessarius TaxID=576610 RepID=UPI0018D53F2C|nr:hypothetical protein [Polynucleobacter necessarius]